MNYAGIERKSVGCRSTSEEQKAFRNAPTDSSSSSDENDVAAVHTQFESTSCRNETTESSGTNQSDESEQVVSRTPAIGSYRTALTESDSSSDSSENGEDDRQDRPSQDQLTQPLFQGETNHIGVTNRHDSTGIRLSTHKAPLKDMTNKQGLVEPSTSKPKIGQKRASVGSKDDQQRVGGKRKKPCTVAGT
eukprot:Seg2051.2 transcript_id=Seg2051.2/GoldUCD/mRNA.D3Y31 product="hypothetical protein" protein_id=Seg2051.2/GoldUCD/D3Y31